jgi:hypothetical protein
MTDRRTTRQLFKEWRAGDAEAGQLMAQQVADWYYAIATSRLGEARGREPCDSACAAFGQGVVDVTDSRKLVPWAHELIAERVKAAGTRASDGDEPSAYTGRQRPKALLRKATEALPDELALLQAVYGADADRSRIDALAEPLGGNPLGILEARYRVKRWLRDEGGIPFEVAPEEPVLDRAPMPLYEADRMASSAEETQFEHWMLTDLDLCKDIAEFAHFSIALRGGIPEQAEAPAPAPTPAAEEPAPAETAPPAAKRPPTGLWIGVAVIVVLLGLGGLVTVAALMGFFAM